MRILPKLFEGNRQWAAGEERKHPGSFTELSRIQKPEYLWIGCADSRVPANQVVGLLAGELFVHRNVANLVVHADMNCLTVIQYAVDVLGVRHIIVCGHDGCGGAGAAMNPPRTGLVDNWIRPIRKLWLRHEAALMALPTEEARVNRLGELNVMAQVRNACHTTIVQAAWQRGQPVAVHGWVYALKDGLLRDLDVTTTSLEELAALDARAP